MNWFWMGLYHGVAMFWETLWALVLGFGISAALQVFVSKEQMTRAFGVTNLRTMSLATGLGAASSSCSYAAVAAGRSAFQQGAALIPALAFMFASTNLVVELGAQRAAETTSHRRARSSHCTCKACLPFAAPSRGDAAFVQCLGDAGGAGNALGADGLDHRGQILRARRRPRPPRFGAPLPSPGCS